MNFPIVSVNMGVNNSTFTVIDHRESCNNYMSHQLEHLLRPTFTCKLFMLPSLQLNIAIYHDTVLNDTRDVFICVVV